MTPPPSFSLSEEIEPGIPDGFRRLLRHGGWSAQLGPTYMRRTAEGGAVLALPVTPAHLNFQGITHGGMLTTLADGALGINVALARGRRAAQVTVSLTADFLSSAREGEWLEAHVTVDKLGRTLAYASCELRVEQRKVLRCTAVFALREGPLPDGKPGTGPAAADGS